MTRPTVLLVESRVKRYGKGVRRGLGEPGGLRILWFSYNSIAERQHRLSSPSLSRKRSRNDGIIEIFSTLNSCSLLSFSGPPAS